MKERYDIHFLRVFSIVCVIGYHYEVQFFSNGFLGVDIFFVISGYLIGRILLNKDLDFLSLLDYYKKRALRILPSLITVVLLVMLMGWYILLPTDYVNLARQSLAALLQVSNVMFMLEDSYFDGDSKSKILLHTWSLSVEMQIYFIIPMILIACGYLKVRIEIVISILLLMSLMAFVYYGFIGYSESFFNTFMRLWQFLVGFVLVLIPRGGEKFLNKNITSTLGVLLIIGALALDQQGRMIYIVQFLVTMGAAILIYSRICFKFYSSKLIILLSGLAFNLYLWHWPLWVLNEQFLFSRYSFVDLIVATFVLSFITFKLVEIKFRIK